jgi:hypothetical protein
MLDASRPRSRQESLQRTDPGFEEVLVEEGQSLTSPSRLIREDTRDGWSSRQENDSAPYTRADDIDGVRTPHTVFEHAPDLLGRLAESMLDGGPP